MMLPSERRRQRLNWFYILVVIPFAGAFGALLGFLFMHPELMR